jgi:ribosomal protein L34E
MTAGQLRDQVVAYLRARAGQRLCVACLAAAHDVPHKRMHDVLLKLEARRGFGRSYGTCSVCDRTRLVVALANQLGGPDMAPPVPPQLGLPRETWDAR